MRKNKMLYLISPHHIVFHQLRNLILNIASWDNTKIILRSTVVCTLIGSSVSKHVLQNLKSAKTCMLKSPQKTKSLRNF